MGPLARYTFLISYDQLPVLTWLRRNKVFSVNQPEVTSQGVLALPWTQHSGDRCSPVTPTGTVSYWSQFQDVTSSKKSQHFSSNVKNGGGDISGQWWNVISAGAGAGQDRATAGVGRSWLRGNFWTRDMFNDFLFWVNPNSSALNPAINSNLYHPVSPFFFQVLLSFKTENFPISGRTYFGHLLYLALSPGIFQGTCRKPQSYPSM